MIWSYILAFCRVAIGLVFLFSAVGKLRDLSQFQQTITNFRPLPVLLSRPTSLLFASTDVTILVLCARGCICILPVFLLALLLLLIYAGALMPVRMRQNITG